MKDTQQAFRMEDLLPCFDTFNENNEKQANNSVKTNDQEKRKQLRLAQKKSRKDRKLAAIIRRNERLSRHPPTNYFVGKHKWLGGAVDPDSGIIYGIPSNSIEIICVHPPSSPSDESDDEDSLKIPSNDSAIISKIPLPNEYKIGYFKWLRGIITNGYLYGIPAWSTNGVLKVRLQKSGKGRRVQVLPLPNLSHTEQTNSSESAKLKGRVCNNGMHNSDPNLVRRDLWMWHGAGLSLTSSPAIYCIPSNVERVLKIDILTDKLTEIGPVFTEGQNKWYGGIRGKDGCIYGVPYTASGVLRIDPSTDNVQVLGKFPIGGWKWHGGLMCPLNGVIYAFPAHANTVLCVDTNPKPPCGRAGQFDDEEWRISTIPIHKHSNDNDPDDLRYKWLGGAYGADGCIYGMPSDASSILRIDPHHPDNRAVATTFGNVNVNDCNASPSVLLNKWQGGVLSPTDGCVYAVPANANTVLKIDTNPNTPLDIEYLDCNLARDSWFENTDYNNLEDKWQGGFLGRDGNIYGIPECVDRVMKLTPGKGAKVDLIT